MKKILIILAFTASFILLPQAVLARVYPEPTGYVNDFADIISQNVEVALEEQLRTLEASSSHELTVVTLSSLEDDVIENTAVELFEQWGIGKKNQDNGVLLLIAPNERELKIEVGYGLEPVLTDSRAGTIIRTIITPKFKENDYDAGILNGVSAIQKTITQDPTAFDNLESSPTTESDFNAVFFIAILMLIYAGSFLARSKRIWPGGVFGIIIGYIFAAVTGAIFLGLWGLFLDFILSKNYKARKKKGLSTAWWSSGGGFSGKSGGGFGGFSGGSSGGGGASGSW